MSQLKELVVHSDAVNTAHLGDSSLIKSGLEKVEIHGIIELGAWAFESCTHINSFFYCSMEPPIKNTGFSVQEWNVFNGDGMPAITVHVPFQSKAKMFGTTTTVDDGN